MFSNTNELKLSNCGSLSIPSDSFLIFVVCSLNYVIGHYKYEASVYYQEYELEIIRKYYRSAGAAFCHSLIPNRSIHSIRHKAEEIGVKHRSCVPLSLAELKIVEDGINNNKTVDAIWYELNENKFPRAYYGVKDKAGEVRKILRRQKSPN